MMVNGEPALTCATYLENLLPGPVRVEPVRHGAGVYWLYRAAGGPNVRWYRFALEPRPAVVPVSPCGEGT